MTMFENENPVMPIDDDATEGGGVSSAVYVTRPSNTYINQQTYDLTGISGITDQAFQKRGCSAVAATMFARIIEMDSSISCEDLYDWGIWRVDDGEVYATWSQNQSSELSFNFRVNNTANWDTYKKEIYDEITNNRPVIIYLTGTGTHFVVAYGLKAGSSRNSLSYSQVYVLDPWDSSFTTLSKTMSFENGTRWSTVKSIRTAIAK